MVIPAIPGIRQRRELKKLVCGSRQRLYRMAYAWTHDPYLADDLVQQTLLKALSNQKQLRDLAAADAWLFRILANCLTDYRRSRREVALSDDAMPVDRDTPEHQVQQLQLARRVRHAVGRLPLPQRQVITLIDLEGFTYASVAETLEMPVGTVMSRLCRGRQALRKFLIDDRQQLQAERSATVTRIRHSRDSNEQG